MYLAYAIHCHFSNTRQNIDVSKNERADKLDGCMYKNIKEKHRGSLHSINVPALKLETRFRLQ